MNHPNVLASPAFSVLANTPFTLEIQLQTAINPNGFGTTFDSSASANFIDTLTFARNGPVFNLEGGYSVNSLDAGIVANSHAVPLPTSFLICASALFTPFTVKAKRRPPALSPILQG